MEIYPGDEFLQENIELREESVGKEGWRDGGNERGGEGVKGRNGDGENE
jgi:hypothetical protein